MTNKIPNWKYNFNNKWDWHDYCDNPTNWIERYKMRGRTKNLVRKEISEQLNFIEE